MVVKCRLKMREEHLLKLEFDVGEKENLRKHRVRCTTGERKKNNGTIPLAKRRSTENYIQMKIHEGEIHDTSLRGEK